MDGKLSSSIQLCHSCTPEIPQGTRQYCNPEPIIMDTNRPQHGVLCTCVKIIWDYVGGPWFSMVSRYHGRYCSTCSCRTLRNLVWYPDTWNILVTIFQICPIFSPWSAEAEAEAQIGWGSAVDWLIYDTSENSTLRPIYDATGHQSQVLSKYCVVRLGRTAFV